MIKIKKIIVGLFLSVICLSPVMAMAQSSRSQQDAAFLGKAQISKVTIGSMAETVIKMALGLLAVIFLILMVYAGYLWMMARGNEDDVKKAKDIIIAAIIGLIIIVAAYSITYFVFNSLNSATGGGGSAPAPSAGGGGGNGPVPGPKS